MAEYTVGIIGGSGLYEIDGLENIEEQSIDTPFGSPSSPVIQGVIEGTRVLFLARHGNSHTRLPSEINYRANIYALKKLGATFCISISAVGSLREEVKPGDIVVPEQLIDRTRGRESTFFGEGIVAHVSFADPYCPVLRDVLLKRARALDGFEPFDVHDGGSLVCMEGPAFSTRAESHLYRSWGASLIGMTALPEAKLAREAELAYATLAMVTDYDCWKEDEKEVDVAQVLDVLRANSTKAKSLVRTVVPQLGATEPSELAASALQGAIMTRADDIPEPVLERLRPIVGRYSG